MSLITELNEGAIFIERIADIYGHEFASELNEILNEVSAGAMGRSAEADFVNTAKQMDAPVQQAAKRVVKPSGDSVGTMLDVGHVIVAKDDQTGKPAAWIVKTIGGSKVHTYNAQTKEVKSFEIEKVKAARKPVKNDKGQVIWAKK